MPRLAALDKDAAERWEFTLPNAPVTLGRLAPQSDWIAEWDKLISRRHATLAWRDGRLHVRRWPAARNAILFKGEQLEDFSLGIGEQFVIGETTFELREDFGTLAINLPTPASEVALDSQELLKVKYTDADERVDALAALPNVIRDAASAEDLEARVVDVLLRGIPRAEAAAVVQLGPIGNSGEPAIAVGYQKARSRTARELQPSQRLILDAVHRRRQGVLHLWEPGDLRAEFTPSLSYDWAICAPLPDDPSPGWALYVAGRLESSISQIGGLLQKEQLKGDMKFAGLVADVFGALRQILHLQRRESQLAIFLPEPVRAAIADQDIDAALAPRQADVTVLFCDLRGSSRIADDSRDDLDGLWDRVGAALGIMTSSIIDQGGVIGDFQGDAAMGFWGWPLDDDDRFERAARAALAIRKRFLQAAQQKVPALAGFNCGIGIASGRATAGRLGTFDQAKVSVYGPRVNLAARLESMTKHFAVPILVDEPTAERLAAGNNSHWARLRRLARVQPYGMRFAETISELLPPAVEAGTLPERDRRNYEAALEAFVAGRWEDARDLLQRLPCDGPSLLLRAHMDRLEQQTPTDWDGVIVMDAK